jgi:cytidylate kinase
MAVITLSRGSFSHGKEIAEAVAQRLGYQCVSREILLEASRFFQVPEMKLVQSIHDAPTILERMTRGREKYLSYIQAALLEHMRADNVVYHGHAGHLLAPPVRHLIKVRVIVPMEKRAAYLRETESISETAARERLTREDEQRTRWTRYLYDEDIRDPALYDLVLNLDRLEIGAACDILCALAADPAFASTPKSLAAMKDLAIASHIRAALQGICPAEVTSLDGRVRVRALPPRIRKSSYASPDTDRQVEAELRRELIEAVSRIAAGIDGVADVVCDVEPPEYH